MSDRAARLMARKTAIAQLVAQLFVGAMVLGTALPVSAASCTWNPASGNWNVAANWSCGFVPTGGPDAASIASGKTVTITTGQSILTLANGGSVNIDQFGLNLAGGGGTTNTGTINVGSASTADLGVSGGHNITNTGGVINIANGSVVNQFGSSITGGTINTTGSGALVAFNSSNNFLSGLALNGTLDLATNTAIERVNGGLTLGGPGVIGMGSASILSLEGTQTIGGTGAVNFGSTASTIQLNATGTTTLAAGVTVHGQNGTIGGGQSFIGGANTLVNNGKVSADVAGGQINLLSAGGGGITNNNILEARNGATLNIQSVGIMQGALGQVNALNGSIVLQNASSIGGGTINTSGTGALRATNSGSNVLTGVTLAGQIDLASATSIERVNGGLTFSGGSINLGAASILSFDGTQTIGGTGTVNFGSTASGLQLNDTGTTTFGAGVIIRGENGTIGGGQSFIGGANTLVNNGTISADVAAGQITLSSAGGGGVTNNNTLEARNGATLNIQSVGVTQGGSGQINALTGSVVQQNSASITGGTINTSGTGVVRATNTANNILSGVTLAGVLDLATATGIERVVGGLTLNSGTINLNNNSILALNANQTIGGTGTIVFGNTGPGSRITLEATAPAGPVTIGSNIVIRGENGTVAGSQIVVGGAVNLINNGRISADVAGGTITLASAAGGNTTNNGILEAQNGGTLLLSSNIIGNPSGQVVAGAGSSVVQNGVTLSGTLNTSGSGVFRTTNSATNIFDGVTLNGNLDMSATSIERVVNGLTLNGTINLNNNSILALNANQTISGPGTIIFGNTVGSNRITLEATAPAGPVTIGSNIVIRGENGTVAGSQIVAGGAVNLINNGRISADVAGGTINLASAAGGNTTNNGSIEALNGGTLLLSSNVVGGATGQLKAVGAGSAVVQNGVALSGVFNLATSGGGVFRATSNSNNFLNGATLNGGTLDLTTASAIERVTGGLTLNGSTISINNAGGVYAQGTQTIGGAGGTITFGAAGANRLGLEDTGTTTIGAGTTINGQNGSIGGGQIFVGGANNLLNQGTIAASVAGGTINIQSAGGGTFTNNGLVHASAGTLNVQQQLLGTGTLQISGTGQLNLANAANSTGQLLANGASVGSTNIGTGNLTVSGDYTNANAGTGNSFNRRANVAGAGQILAGGDAAQGITGTGVTNGNTTNATLTLNNVRVGATTFNYQVANTGTTGPSLRGAIQTAVNGGNLTDTRLSGAGVTASNYNTGAPGSSTGNLAVTFTAASAGALAPLSGQVLNLRSNFDNIADQKLNIVLGSGAAAFNAAIGSATPSPVTVANQRIGGSNTAALTVANTAATGSFSEDLNASFGAPTGQASGSGSIAGRLAGTNNTGTGAMSVAVATGSAGAKTGTVTLNYQTAGAVAGVSNGLGTASVGSQTITVNGNVYQVAQPTALPGTVNLNNFRAGTAQSQTVTLTNTNVAPGFQEGLNASITGTTGAGTGTGVLNNVAAGSSGNLQIGVTGVAGINTGTVQVQLATNGTGTSGLGDLNLGGAQTVNVTGTGYRLAQANTQPLSINFGNVLVGSSQAQFLNIQNTATADGFSERLDSRFLAGGTTGDATNNNGSVSLLAAGAPANNTAMAVGVSTATIGGKSGQVVVAFDSNGAGTSGLGITGLPNQNIGILANVTANVGTLAQPSAITPNPVNFGNFRLAAPGAGPVNLSISNNATVGEGLNASIATGSAGFAATGAFTGLAPTATNSSSLQVSFNGTGTVGAKSGTATVTLVSDGTFNGGTTTALPSQTLSLNANVFNVAQPTALPAAVNIGSFRTTGSPVTQAVSLTNSNISPAGFQEGLNASITGTSGNAVASGALNNVAAGASGSLQIGVAGVAGVNSGTAQVQLASNGTGTSGLVTLNLGGPQTINVTGLGYTTAVGQVSTSMVDFGIVRVGDTVTAKNITVRNVAGVTALNDSLRANLTGVAGPFTPGSGSVGGIAAGGASGNIAVGLNTTAAGISNQTGTVKLLSHNGDLSDVSAGADASVQFKAQVNNLANARFGLFAGVGALTQAGNVFTLELGNILLGSSSSLKLKLDNNVAGPADDLSGLFNLAGVNDFTLNGWGAIGPLAAGQASGELDVSYVASVLGMFTDTIAFNGFSTNASDLSGIAQSRQLIIHANVINTGGTVPEPGTLALVLLAVASAVLARRWRTMAH